MTKMIAMIDGPMISRFIENSDAFNKCADERFDLIEQNCSQKVIIVESTALDDCDDNRTEVVDRETFRGEMTAAMAAVAEMIGKSPVNVLVEDGSLMMKVYEAEIARIEKEKEQMEMKMRNGNHEREWCHENEEEEERENGEIVGPKKMMKKKSSRRFLSFCACSGKYNYVDDS